MIHAMQRSMLHPLKLSQHVVNTGYTYSRSSSYSSCVLECEKERQRGVFQPPVMSRRSLRLPNSERYGDDSFLERSAQQQPYSSTPHSLGKGSSAGHRGLKSRRSQQMSVSCSQSLLHQTPPSASSSHRQHGSQSFHSVAASDATLLSSMLEESAMEEKTVLDSFWGLDQDADPTESTLLADPSANSTVLSSCDVLCPKHPSQTQTSIINGHHYCSDCVLRPDRKEALTATSTTDLFSSSRLAGADHHERQTSHPTTTIYGRDKIRKNRKGVLVSVGDTGVSVIRRWAGCVSRLLTMFYINVLLKIRHDGAGMMWSLWESRLQCYSRALTSIVWLLTLVSQACRGLAQRASQATQHAWRHRFNPQAHSCNGQRLYGDSDSTEFSQYCGVVNVKGMGTNGKPLDRNGSLCTCLWWLAQTAGSAGWDLSKKLMSSGWCSGQPPGKARHHLVTLAAFLKDVLMMRSLPKLLPLLLVVIPLLLCGVWWLCGPGGLLSVVPAVNVTQWGTSLSSLWSSADSPAHEETTTDVQASVETPHLPTAPTAHSQEGEDGGEASSSTTPGAPERLLRLEQSVSRLWQQVEAGGRRVEQRHGDVVQLFRDLQQQVQDHSRPALEPWVSGLLEDRLDGLRRQLEEEGQSRVQSQQQYVLQQEKQASHLAELEVLIKSLAVKTEEFQRRQEAIPTTVAASPSTLPVPVSVGVDRDSHNALLAEVDGLKSTLEGVRQDLQGLVGVQERCEQQDNIQETISARVKAQVREELRVLFYGNQLSTGREASSSTGDAAQSQLPRQALLQWLTERYVSREDLQADLHRLELSILEKISLKMTETQTQDKENMMNLQMETQGREAGPESQGRESELCTSMTEEEVKLIVKDALRLYSEDRTSMPDFALESGGGSILSTRCSETYEIKTALLSLFGVPLWYFTQSPRVVIQPHIQPGNCWAFKGSQGYLVIRLSTRVLPTAFSLEHMPKALAPNGRLHSAPKDFTVYGLDDEKQANGTFLGRYTYEEDGEALQTYTVTEQNERSFQIMEVQVLSNWGHPEYTCMYRFRVHGKPSSN